MIIETTFSHQGSYYTATIEYEDPYTLTVLAIRDQDDQSIAINKAIEFKATQQFFQDQKRLAHSI